MLDDENPDQFLSYTELSKDIRAFAKMIPINDFIIFPFSEMARFYDNDTYKEFDSLVTTIRGQEAPQDAQEAHVRLYIPINYCLVQRKQSTKRFLILLFP